MRRQVSTVIAEGDRRASLEAIRDKLARELHRAAGRDAAVIAKELRAVIADLDALAGGKEASTVDDLTARRAARRADAASR
ncbi:hypothetical protein FHS43_000559 [Streptosporangium becharense]|uniref:Uncharacterized protein n=1 Tax=Streptosporangium becharense TaxID=1816182 RepID=A0A7W9MKQ3_9ACTN|nr:hypothetical protein [Streptosporangium becharense]MBB2909313.1 hypothetical protein [Streptosporangium becharense]MBB5823784.1 hypothetical protein [Streptosporangium becharense]